MIRVAALIRHATADAAGRLCGRTDVGLAESADAELSELAALLPPVGEIIVSPAKRCRLTASALWPNARLKVEDRLLEQDFGEWDGLEYTRLPDLGDLTRDDLASLRAPEGESFLDLLARARPELEAAAEQASRGGPVFVVAHAGIVRAGLSMVLGEASAGLAFEIAPLSLTWIRCLEGGSFSIGAVGWRPAG